MLVALDFDGTYTLDPELWNNVIDMFKRADHNVICVTMRYPEEGSEVELTIGKRCDIIYTSRLAKEPYLNNLGIYPNIWIDDYPAFIFNNADGVR